MDNEMGELTEVKRLVDAYRTRHGDDLDQLLGRIFTDIVKAASGDDLALLKMHLEQVLRLVDEMIRAAEVVPVAGAVSWN